MYSLTKEKGILSEKILYVSSSDRDICKWPNSNCFEIQLPETFKNVAQMELMTSQFYLYIHTFTQENQNLAFSFKIPRYTHDPIMCVISEGSYSLEDMRYAIEKALNEATTRKLQEEQFFDTLKNNYVSFEVKLGPSKKLEIHNRDDPFELLFEEQIGYKVNCKNPNTKWFQSEDWGLGYNLGFEKKKYQSIYDPLSTRQILRAPNVLVVNNEKYIFMEIEKYNSIDELIPYSIATSNLYDNDYGGTVNKSFALIKIYNELSITSDKDWNSDPIYKFNTPESISKLKFKFRHHNGDLVNFENQPFSFELKFNIFI
jgi:hypothetical protein